MYAYVFSCVRLCDPIDCSPPGSSVRGISQQEYWNGLPFPFPGDLPNPGTEPAFLCLLHYRQILLPLNHRGSPSKIQEEHLKHNSKKTKTAQFKNGPKLFWGRRQDGGGIGRVDHFLSYKFVKRMTERRANFIKQLLIASWGHQMPRKATHCLQKEVGQNKR